MKERWEETPLKQECRQVRRMPLALGVATTIELLVLTLALFLRPTFSNECAGVPLGTWTLFFLLFCLVHLGYSCSIDWLDQVSAQPVELRSLLKVIQLAALLLAVGWLGAGHYWAFKALSCSPLPSLTFPSLALPMCDTAAAFCLLLGLLGWMPRGSSPRPGLFD